MTLTLLASDPDPNMPLLPTDRPWTPVPADEKGGDDEKGGEQTQGCYNKLTGNESGMEMSQA